MKARCKLLSENSLSSALSAIEIYNKPDFRHREQVFAVLMVIAWESLLKAKILRDSGNRLNSLYLRDGRRFKRNRTGQCLTINLQEAVARCNLSPIVTENLTRLVEIRDAAVHLTASSPSLPYLVFTLGSASLRNYSRLLRQWFAVGLSDYNFYILPLGFEYPFSTLSSIDLHKEPEDIALILRAVATAQERDEVEDGEFALICELKTTLVAAKKVTTETDLIAKVDSSNPDALVISREVSILDKYPYTWTQVYAKLRAIDAGLKANNLNALIRERRIKSNPTYARHNYRSKTDEARGPQSTTPVLYNEAFFQLARTELCQEALPLSPAQE